MYLIPLLIGQLFVASCKIQKLTQSKESHEVSIINQLINEIDRDTSLKLQLFTDSLGTKAAYFGNDTLIKVLTGKSIDSTFENFLSLLDNRGYEYFTYYYISNNLVAVNYECASFESTSSCNPISISSKFYFKEQRLIGQEHADNVGRYFLCGCAGASFHFQEGKISELENKLIEESHRLKQILKR